MTISSDNLLNEAVSLGIINISGVQEIIMATKRQQIKKQHPFKITAPPDSNHRWQTYVKNADGKRSVLRAQTEEELLDKLIAHYSRETHLENLFSNVYEEWIEYKKSITSSPNTITRHRQHYKKYFENSILKDKPIDKIDELMLEKECNRIVRDYNLSRKEWGNVKTVLKGMFEYAVRKKILKENPLDRVQIKVKYRQIVKKSGKTQTYNTEELQNLNQYLIEKFAETGDSSFIGIQLNFYLGLRVGELAALKWSDIEDEKLHVTREEIRDQELRQYYVVEHTKTNHDRYVILVPKALELLSKIERTGDYIFMRNGERIYSRQFAYVLEKYAERMSIPTKSTHKVRKTYASRLNAAGVPLDCIREMLGHTELTTTLGYIYNPLTDAETYKLLEAAL